MYIVDSRIAHFVELGERNSYKIRFFENGMLPDILEDHFCYFNFTTIKETF